MIAKVNDDHAAYTVTTMDLFEQFQEFEAEEKFEKFCSLKNAGN